MKTLLVVESTHCGNTLKIANAMAEVAPITITDTEKAKEINLSEFDLVGFGSGIYMGKHDKKILDFVENLSEDKSYTFVFSTSGGADFNDNNKALIELLKKKNKIVLGSFACKALDKFFVLKLLGGINKGLPNEQDFNNAKSFIMDMLDKCENI